MKFETVRIHVFSLLSSRNFATIATWRNHFSSLFILIGHFRVPKNRTFKTRLSAKPLLWKWVLFASWLKIIFISKVGFFGTRKWPLQSFSRDLRYVISPSWSLGLSCEWYTWVSLVFGAAKPAARDGTFTFNSKECSKPAPIDGIVYHSVDINIHRSTNIEGYCGGIPAGKVQVGFNVGDCTGSGYKAGDAWTSWYQTIRIIIEEVEPPVA